MNDSPSRHILVLVTICMALLMLLSSVPWSRLTNNRIKDFDLFEDLYTASETQNEGEPLSEFPDRDSTLISMPVDSIVSDSIAADSVYIEPAVEAPVINGIVALESYRADRAMLPHFRKALEQSGMRTVRVAVIGDSFIEGDIICQDLREAFQSRFGGQGVGYMALHTEFPGFRRSVRQTDGGWTGYDVRNMKRNDTIRTISGAYAKAAGTATASYSGTSFSPHTSQWNRTSFYFIAPDSGSVTISADGVEETMAVMPSGKVQAMSLSQPTKTAKITTDIPGLVALGAFLDGASGVQVDCMSVRGNAGYDMRKVNHGMSGELAKWVDYDLIIIEYGTNAVSAEQRNYSPYASSMAPAVENLKRCYPDADIIVMGIADRGEKVGTAIKSLPVCAAMVNAQRRLAVNTGVHFWDTRAAMGGADAVVQWRKDKLMNADYTHLNHDGGKKLATLLYNAIIQAVDE